MRNFRRFSEQILEMLFPYLYLFFLAVSFHFSSLNALPSASFVYRLLCFPRLSIFNRVSNVIDMILYVFCLFFYVFVSKFILFLFKFLGIDIGWVLPIAFGSSFHVCTLFCNRWCLPCLALYLVGMNSAAASKWELTKFSYSSIGVCVSVFSCSSSDLFLSVNAYLSLISLLLSRDQS